MLEECTDAQFLDQGRQWRLVTGSAHGVLEERWSKEAKVPSLWVVCVHDTGPCTCVRL